MDKGIGSDLFVNDGSFMERFKKMQAELEAKSSDQTAAQPSQTSTLKTTPISGGKRPPELRPTSSSTKLAFSLKKSKAVVAPVKLAEDEDEEEQALKLESNHGDEQVKQTKVSKPQDLSSSLMPQIVVAPSPPSDMSVRTVADRLAISVAKQGRQFEHITRQKNPGDTPYKFLFDKGCSDYKYYEYRLMEEEKALAQLKESYTSKSENATTSSSRAYGSYQRSHVQQKPNYQTPAAALYGAYGEGVSPGSSYNQGGSSGSAPTDPIALMEFYAKKAAHEERKRPPRQSKDEMPPPPSLQAAPGKKGHHMGDFIPQEELEKFMARCNDAAAQKAAQEAAEKAKIQADNIGHRLLSKMGWKEGEGLGGEKTGRTDPVMHGGMKNDTLGVGAVQPGEVNPDDDIYEQYKKRMMLGYRHRPNPLNNPRKAYY